MGEAKGKIPVERVAERPQGSEEGRPGAGQVKRDHMVGSGWRSKLYGDRRNRGWVFESSLTCTHSGPSASKGNDGNTRSIARRCWHNSSSPWLQGACHKDLELGLGRQQPHQA